MSDGQPEVRLELYVRSLLPHSGCESQEAVLDRLQELADAGAIDAFEVSVWGRGIGPATAAAGTDVGRELQGLVETVSAWAREQGLSLHPWFEPRPVRSRLTGEEYEAVHFPAMAVTAFRDDDLAFVAPCADGGTAYTVGDVLDAFEAAHEGDAGPVDPGGLSVEGSDRTVREAAGPRE